MRSPNGTAYRESLTEIWMVILKANPVDPPTEDYLKELINIWENLTDNQTDLENFEKALQTMLTLVQADLKLWAQAQQFDNTIKELLP